MAKVADVFVETLVKAGVNRIYGIAGDSLNGLTDSIRTHDGIDWMMVRHEEVAAFAAGGESQITGELTVCAGSCGPGNLHLINGLHDCQRSRVPVLAIAAQIPSAQLGTNFFQETRPEHLFLTCSDFCEAGSPKLPAVLAGITGVFADFRGTNRRRRRTLTSCNHMMIGEATVSFRASFRRW